MTTAELYEKIEALKENDSFTIERMEVMALRLDNDRMNGILRLFKDRSLTFFTTHDLQIIVRRGK
jgi:hypothetical protein